MNNKIIMKNPEGQEVDVTAYVQPVDGLLDEMDQPVKVAERFKKPTDEQVIGIAILFNDGKMEPEKLSDMVAMCQYVIDRLYENGDILIPSSKENNNE